MNTHAPWLLPEGIDETLPPRAETMETLRRRVIDLFHGWGYELVAPPLMEYLDSLLTGVGTDLKLQTFTVTDQLNGRLMGIRADMTPQVARIEAHHLKRDVPVRLCYLGVVLHTLPSGFGRLRNPLQVGAELYGYPGVEADAEVLCLMLRTLASTGIDHPYLDIGHVGVFRSLCRQCELPAQQERAVFDILQRKATPEIDQLLKHIDLDTRQVDWLRTLIELNGGIEVLAEARTSLHDAPRGVHEAIDDMERLAELAHQHTPLTGLHFDLAELRGYGYHTGLVFAAYVPGHGQAIAQGGRYDGIGKVFGRARPATGFSTDLKTLTGLNPANITTPRPIFAPCTDDPTLLAYIAELRDEGERVICALPGQQGDATDMGCSRELRQEQGTWRIVQV